MCPITAVARWWLAGQELGLEQGGYVFRKQYKGDRLGRGAGDVMAS